MIAISYRREDSLPVAGRLYDRLQSAFGKENVFMDFDSIPYGVDFREQIKGTIERSKMVVAVIGPNWLGHEGGKTRRIDDPNDFVRFEIACALERGVPVIPVLVNNTVMPRAEKLPRDIEGLAFRNALTLHTGVDFHHHADRLIAGIRKAAGIRTEDTGGPVPDSRSAARRKRRLIALAAAALLTAAGVALTLSRFIPRELAKPAEKPTPSVEVNAQPASAKPIESPVPAPTAQVPSYNPIPNGYSVLEFTVSPDRRFGVIAPDAEHFIEGALQHQIVDLKTGQVIGLIQADSGFSDSKVKMGHGGINPAHWSADSSVLLWEVEGRWSPRALALVKIAEDGRTIKWQRNLLKDVQREILDRTRKAAPDKYAKASQMNNGSGSAYPDGFVVNVRAITFPNSSLSFPLKVHAGLTSDPKGDHGRAGEMELNSELDSFVDANGSLTIGDFHLSDKPGWQIAVMPQQFTASETPQVSPAPASNPNWTRGDRAWQAWIGDFVRGFVAANQLTDTTATVAFYAPAVEYFDEGQKDQAYIRSDVDKYNQRWPVRRDAIEGDIHLQERTPNQQYSANFKLNFAAASSARSESVHGQFLIDLGLTVINGSPKISAIKEKVLRREKGSSAVGEPNDGGAAAPSAPAKQNAFGMAEGKYMCEYVKGQNRENFVDKSDKQTITLILKTSNWFTIRGTRFSLLTRAEDTPTSVGKARHPELRHCYYIVQWDGNITANGGGVYTFKPDGVQLAEKFPKDLQANTDIEKHRKNLPKQKWTLRYEDGRLIQPIDGEIWTLVR